MENVYKKVTLVKSISEEDVKRIAGTGICLTKDKSHVVNFYVLADEKYPTKATDEVLVLVSENPAKETAVLKSGEVVPLSSDLDIEDIKYVGYIAPGPHITYGKVEAPAGTVHGPAATIGRMIWTGNECKKVKW